jgi:hypothetical protein
MKIVELSGAITADSIAAVMHKELPVLRVKNFFNEDSCSAIADRLINSSLYGKYANAPLIGRVGRAFFETTVSHQALMDYFSESKDWFRMLRDACEPNLTPIDKLRLQLDEHWAHGAQLGRIAGRTMYAGLIRVFDEGAYAEPHQDHLDWDAAQHEIYEDVFYTAQIAANVYLHMPDEGGELAIWHKSLARTEYDARRISGSYGVDTSGFGDPVVLQPEKGELILFNARHIHCVNAPKKGNRVTASCFVGYRHDGQPLSIWS